MLNWLKQKEEKKPELTDQDKKILERLDVIKEKVRQLQSDLNYGLIAQWQYEIRMHRIIEELDDIESILGKDYTKEFDDMMGHPMEFLDDLFKFEDKAVKEIEDEIDRC